MNRKTLSPDPGFGYVLSDVRRVTFGTLASLAMVLAACGGDAASTTTTTTLPATTTSSTATSTTLVSPTTSTTHAASTTTMAAATTTTTLAGTPVDFGPAEGDVLMVIGVRYDDVLNLRAAPGADQPISAEIPPTYTELVAEGNTWQLPSSFWVEVDYEGTAGWVHMSYIGYEGDTSDDTSRIVSELGENPVEAIMTDLGELVAELYATDDEQGSDVVQVTPVGSGDLSEVTYDVVGLADDAIRGVRLHIFAEEATDGFSLKSVEVTAICGRGVDDGVCV
jgi:hypothetical protein